MKKWIVGLFIFGLVMGIALYGAGGFLIDRASRFALQYISEYAGEVGTEITEADFKSVFVQPFTTITWNDISVKGRRISHRTSPSGTVFSLTVRNVTVQLSDFSRRMFRLKAKNINAVLSRSSKANQDQLIGTDFKTEFRFDFTNPKEAIASGLAFVRDLANLVSQGRCRTFVRFTGHVTFTMNEKLFDTDLFVERRGDESVLVLDREALRLISHEFEEELTDQEIEILSEHPLRAPGLLRITKDAYRIAESVHERDPRVSEDAFRHVIWSYL